MGTGFLASRTGGFGAALLAAAVCGCSQQPVEVTSIFQSQHCNVENKTLRVIDDNAELNRIASTPVNPLAERESLQIAFGDKRVILAAWGRRPNAGYSIALTGDKARSEGDALYLPIAFRSPEPGGYQAQMVTSPCLVVALPRTDHDSLVVREMTLDVTR